MKTTQTKKQSHGHQTGPRQNKGHSDQNATHSIRENEGVSTSKWAEEPSPNPNPNPGPNPDLPPNPSRREYEDPGHEHEHKEPSAGYIQQRMLDFFDE